MFFDLRDDRDRRTSFLDLAPRVEDVLAGAHERKGDHIDLLGDAEGEVLLVAGGERAYVQARLWEVDSLVGAEDAADDDAAPDLVPADLHGFQFDLTVAQ